MVKVMGGAVRNGKVIDNEAKGNGASEVSKIARSGRLNVTRRT